MPLIAFNEYRFVTHWFVPNATIEEVAAVVADVEGLPRWWPAVYRDVHRITEGDAATGVGRRYDLTTKGWLPYRLRWTLTVLEQDLPRTSTIGASGDLSGRGIWTFTPTGNGVAVTFDWRVRAAKPLLRLLSPLVKPIFAVNHHWAMATGEVSLRREVLRRRAAPKAGDANPIPPPLPPGPTTWQPYAIMTAVMAALSVSGTVWLFRNKNSARIGEPRDRGSVRATPAARRPRG